jgi:poly(A) polymerase Pap1
MNAAEYKKLLEFKEKFPTIGLDLVRALREKTVVIHLTVDECINLCQALDLPWAGLFNQIFDAFKSKP